MDDGTLWDAFSSSSLPADRWTHREHLRVAWMFLKKHSLDEAHLLMRVGIIRLNAFHALVETPARGYHETLTRVWLVLIASHVGNSRADTSEAFLEASGSELGREAALRHYSRDHLMSVTARSVFVAPDLLPLPPVPEAPLR